MTENKTVAVLKTTDGYRDHNKLVLREHCEMVRLGPRGTIFGNFAQKSEYHL